MILNIVTGLVIFNEVKFYSTVDGIALVIALSLSLVGINLIITREKHEPPRLKDNYLEFKGETLSSVTREHEMSPLE